MHDALTDLHAYVLLLDAEWQKLGERMEELTLSNSTSTECFELAQARLDMAEELAALRKTIALLRADADAAGSLPTVKQLN